MPSVSANTSFQAYREQWRSERGPRLAEQLCNVSHFFSRLRMQLSQGELTRAPLKMLRLQVEAETVECDWLARPPDPWDAYLPQKIGRRHATLQALRDAIDVRTLLFRTLPDVETAYLRIYRETPNLGKELIINGDTQRNDNLARGVHSLVMRAKVLGFRFRLDDDVLSALASSEQPASAANF
jgi:hypothetical protein